MQVKTITKHLKISPKKMRLVARLISGMDVEAAFDYLRFIPKKAAPVILKALNSTISNAEHNFHLKKENLFIKEIFVNQGPVLKRWTPRAFGRAGAIRKKSSHLGILLEEKVPEIKISKPKKEKEPAPEPPFKKEAVAREEVREKALPRQEKRSLVKEKGKEIFDVRRKAGRRTKQHLDKTRLKKEGGVIKRIFRRKSI